MPVLFPNATVSPSQSDPPAGLWQGGSTTNGLHSLKPKIFMSRGTGKKCALTFYRNLSCNLSWRGWDLAVGGFHKKWPFIHECFHRRRGRPSCFGQCFRSPSGKWSPAPQLLRRRLKVPFSFRHWSPLSGMITGVWWMPRGETSSRCFSSPASDFHQLSSSEGGE